MVGESEENRSPENTQKQGFQNVHNHAEQEIAKKQQELATEAAKNQKQQDTASDEPDPNADWDLMPDETRGRQNTTK